MNADQLLCFDQVQLAYTDEAGFPIDFIPDDFIPDFGHWIPEGLFDGLEFPAFESELDFALTVVQQPQHGRVALGKEKDRKPLDPPPFIELTVSRKKDPHANYLQSPYYFMTCSILKNSLEDEDPRPNALMGSSVSSLHRLKDAKNGDCAYFIFGDLSVRYEGKFRLLFNLYQMAGNECVFLASTTSDSFEVFPAKSFPGLMESTFMTRSFSDQGVRLRVRKDSRSITTRKRNQSVADFAAAHHVEEQQAVNGRSEHGNLPMRPNGMDDGSSGFGSQNPSYYGALPAMMQHSGLKRKRPEDDTGVPSLDVMAGYLRHGFHPSHAGLHPLQTQLATTTTGFTMQSPATAPPVAFGSRHLLGRIDTSTHGRPPAPSSTPNSAHPFLSPHTRQSPHSSFHPYAVQSPATTLTFSSAPTSAAVHPQLLGSHGSDFRNLAGSFFAGHTGAEGNPRTHPVTHAVNPIASSSTSPSEANYTPAPPQEPYSSVPGAYSYPAQGMGHSLADPRNAPLMNLAYTHDPLKSASYDGNGSSNAAYQSIASTAGTAYHHPGPSGPSTAASAYQDNGRAGNAYQDSGDKANGSQQ